MKFSQKNRYSGVFKAVSAGLATAQVIGFVHVYLSNRHLYENMLMVRKAGYMAVPNEHVWQSLQSLGPAVWGGMFFALSIGAGLSVAALLGAWIWDRLFGRWRPPLVILFFAWILAIFAVNDNNSLRLCPLHLPFDCHRFSRRIPCSHLIFHAVIARV